MGEVFVRRDGSTGKGWDNARGVIRAIEEYLNVKFDEKTDFMLLHGDWFIRHTAICNGFLAMERDKR